MCDSRDFEDFIDATIKILSEDGIDSYLPTIYIRAEIVVIEGIPKSVSDTEAICNVGADHQLGQEGTFFAVRTSSDTVTCGGFTATGAQFVEIQRQASEFIALPTQRPDWLRI